MISVSVKMRVHELTRDVMGAQKQIRYATAVALTRTAKFAESKVKEEIARVFDRPTPYTLSATRVKSATKADLRAEVKIKDEALKAKPAIRWLAPQIYGGKREAKNFEYLLRTRGILGSDEFAVPGVGARLDGYGNMSRGQIVQILSQVGASRDSLANQTAASKKRRGRKAAQYFAITTQRNGLRPGIYQRFGFAVGSAVRPVLVFVKSARYRPRLKFFEVAQGAAEMRFEIEFARALRDAMRTAEGVIRLA